MIAYAPGAAGSPSTAKRCADEGSVSRSEAGPTPRRSGERLRDASNLNDLRGAANGCFGDAGALVGTLRNEMPMKDIVPRWNATNSSD